MKILYVGPLGRGSTSSHRCEALQRLGHETLRFDVSPYLASGTRIARWLRYRALLGQAVNRFNRDLLTFVNHETPDLVWMDKVLFAQPQTIRAIARSGVKVIGFNSDNPFGPRDDPGWRLLVAAIPEYDAHIVSHENRIASYLEHGAKHVIFMPMGYEPSVHFAPPDQWSDADRDHDVLFIGHLHDDRREFILKLWKQHGIQVHVRGPKWGRMLHGKARAAIYGGGPIVDAEYRNAIWRSRICLGFVTASNLDVTSRRSFEITACKSFLLTERTEEQAASFAEGEEAVMYDRNDADECAELISRYLPDEAARQRISASGHRRAMISGYANDDRLEVALGELAELEGIPSTAGASSKRWRQV